VANGYRLSAISYQLSSFCYCSERPEYLDCFQPCPSLDPRL
jgi:hypothetical protein